MAKMFCPFMGSKNESVMNFLKFVNCDNFADEYSDFVQNFWSQDELESLKDYWGGNCQELTFNHVNLKIKSLPKH